MPQAALLVPINRHKAESNGVSRLRANDRAVDGDRQVIGRRLELEPQACPLGIGVALQMRQPLMDRLVIVPGYPKPSAGRVKRDWNQTGYRTATRS